MAIIIKRLRSELPMYKEKVRKPCSRETTKYEESLIDAVSDFDKKWICRTWRLGTAWQRKIAHEEYKRQLKAKGIDYETREVGAKTE